MCGIAGYNISAEWAEKFVNQEKMELVLQEAWLHNLHRGYDAAGYMAIGVDEKMQIFKKPGLATEILIDDIWGKNLIKPAVVFGAHTRQPSVGCGDPKDNINNHPVGWDGVWVTHNGSIGNDEGTKKFFSKMPEFDKVVVPEVDSVAIAMELSLIEGPFDHDEIVSALEGLWGDMAMHAIWDEHPGVSLFARSQGKPFVFAYHPNGAVFYGSEADSVWNMIRKMGIDPNDKAWKWRRLEDDAYFVVENGMPLLWGSFATADQDKNKAAYSTRRLIPVKNSAPVVIYETDLNYDYANKYFRARSALELPSEIFEKDIEYKHGQVDHFPLTSDMNLLAVASEADTIVKQDGIHHIFVGDVEIVVSGRSIKDIFNHKRYTNEERWDKVEKAKVIKEENESMAKSFPSFMIKKSLSVNLVPEEASEYQYVINARIAEAAEAKKKEDEAAGKALAPIRIGKNFSNLAEMASIGTDFKLVVPDISLDWSNIYDKECCVLHNDEPGFAFLYDGLCPDHNQVYTEHKNPHECSITLHAATICMSALQGVDLFAALDWSNSVIQYNMSETWCSGNESTNSSGNCWFAYSEDVTVYYGKARWIIKTQETCLLCGSTRTLEELPWWFENVEHGPRTKRAAEFIGH